MSNSDENSAPERISLVTAINMKYGSLYDRKKCTDAKSQLLPAPRESNDLILKIKTSDHLPGKRRGEKIAKIFPNLDQWCALYKKTFYYYFSIRKFRTVGFKR